MTDETVSPAEAADQPDHFAEIAAELRKAADQVETLVGSGLPKPCQFVLNIQPGGRGDDELTARAVDAMAGALLGIRGEVHKMSGGTYHYATDQIDRGPIAVTVYQGVSTEWALEHDVAAAEAEMAEREADLEKARARVAELRGRNADATGLSYSREADDPTPVSPARVPLHTGGVVGPVDGGTLVDETPVVLSAADCSHRDDPGHDERVHADECIPAHARNEARR